MNCGCDDILFVRAGDAWTMRFSYTLDGVAVALPDGARVNVIDEAGTVVLVVGVGMGLTINQVAGTIDMVVDGADTLALAPYRTKRDLTLGLKVFDTADESGTGETIAAATVVAAPRIVA